MIIYIQCTTVLEVGLAQTSYSIGDESESIQVCVVASPGGPTFGDSNVPAIAINVATTGDSATGEEQNIYSISVITLIPLLLDGDDYTLSGSSVSFSSTTNSSGECVTITSQPDSLVEGTETLTVSISSPLPARATTDPALSTAVVSIGDSEGKSVSQAVAFILRFTVDNY